MAFVEQEVNMVGLQEDWNEQQGPNNQPVATKMTKLRRQPRGPVTLCLRLFSWFFNSYQKCDMEGCELVLM